MQTQSSTLQLQLRRNLIELITAGYALFKASSKLTVSELAEQKRYISPDESARPGQWDNSVVPFSREIMDAFTDPQVERITGMFSAQVVKTEILKNCIAWVIDQDPAPMLTIYPSDGDARDFSTEKLEPMFKHNSWLRDKISVAKSNSKENKTLFKKFIGGFLAIAGARVPQELARRSVKYIFADDRDRIGLAGSEGNAVALAWERTESFAKFGRKLMEFSTPTIEGESAIKKAYLLSNQSEYYVPCPFCNTPQTLKLEQLKWEKDIDAFEVVVKHYPETTYYECETCHEKIDEAHKPWMLANGKWVAKHPERIKHKGYWLNRLYSTFSSWAQLAEKFLEAKNNPDDLQVFYNTVLAKTWKREDTEELDETGLMDRCEDYLTDKNNFRIPNEVLLVVLIVDTQADRMEYQVIGFGLQGEAWMLEYDKLYGDPDQDDVYNELEEIQKKRWTREDGVQIGIYHRPGLDFPVFIDSGGKNTASVYRQCRKRYGLGWIAIKGVYGDEKPILMNMSTVGPAKDTRLQNIGVDSSKTLIHKMLRRNTSPMKLHFTSAYANIDYFTQLTSERAVKELNKRTLRYGWTWKKKSAHARNEVLDLWSYGIACFQKFNANMAVLKARYDAKAALIKDLAEHPDNAKAPEIKKQIDSHPRLRRKTIPMRRP